MDISFADITRSNKEKYNQVKQNRAMVWVTYKVSAEDATDNSNLGRATFTVNDLKEIKSYVFTGISPTNNISTDGALITITGNQVEVKGVSGAFGMSAGKKLNFLFIGY